MIMKKQRNDQEEVDRISQLPQPLLHHILCYLSQKHAVQTCVLSKSWRHLGPNRPKIEFREELLNGNEEEMSLSVLEKTLQRYHAQNLSIQEFIFAGMKEEGSKSFPLLEKWVPLLLLNMNVNKFHLSIDSSDEKNSEPAAGNRFRLPSSVLLKAEFLKELKIDMRCQIDPVVDGKVLCKNLRKLSLNSVYISDEALEKITSSCPLIEDLGMFSCKGFETIKMTKAQNLQFFQFISICGKEGCHSIEIIDAPRIESISIYNCPNWIHHPDMYFPRLKSLYLFMVPLSNESIEKFSTNLPCLVNLTLSACFSDSEQIFQLSSRSIKHLTIVVEGSSLEAAIFDVTNIMCFDFKCEFLPSISFTTTSTEWKSIVRVNRSKVDFRIGALSWFHGLGEIFEALSASQISLHIDGIPKVVRETRFYLNQPLVIENLSLEGNPCSSVPDFLNCLFRNFRPRNIVQQIRVVDRFNKREHQLIDLLCKILLSKSERARCFGHLNLEDAKMEAFYENEKEWCRVEGTSCLLECDERAQYYQKFRFRLKWRIE